MLTNATTRIGRAAGWVAVALLAACAACDDSSREPATTQPALDPSKPGEAASAPAGTNKTTGKTTGKTTSKPTTNTSRMSGKVKKTDEEWRAQLTEEQFHVTRKAGTERPFTGQYWKTKTSGTYECVCCGEPLFHSSTKFDSGTGWPSFTSPVVEGKVASIVDRTHGMVRTEVTCDRCDAHLGHLFEDGPAPTGLRYCINSASLSLKPDG